MSILGFGWPRGDARALPVEIGFLAAQGFAPAMLVEAAAIAEASGTDAATALMANGLMSEAAYYRALAQTLGAPFIAELPSLGSGARYPDSIVAGLAPLAPGACSAFVFAPRGGAIRELLDGRSPTGRLPAITTPTALRLAVFAMHPGGIAAYAADELGVRRPDWALKTRAGPPVIACAGLALWVGVAALLSLPAVFLAGIWTLMQVCLLALLTFRIAAVSIEPADVPLEELPASELPVYTILVALHREAPVLPRLILALSRFDYPAAKLDIKFLIEADDASTASALAA